MMKKLMLALLTLTLLLSLALPGLADGNDRLLTVSGSATVSIDADYATIEIGVTTRASSAIAAQKENEGIMNEVINAITALDIKKEDIGTSMFSIYTDQDMETRMPVYMVSNNLFITIKDIAKVSQVIDTASAKGANNVYGLSFHASKNPDATREAITLAVKDARNKAAMLAEAAGITLGDIVRIDLPQNNSGFFMGRENVAMAEDSGGGSPILSGKVAVTADVTIVFGIK
ncbi:MAG: SIMPL domain-containing protein [Christensenellales bacterium]|jgi:uncharacterized protein YggE